MRSPAREPGALGDAAMLGLPSGERLAFSTDSFVVKPLRFPGGSIGHLAVHGTVNDLAVMGATPDVDLGRVRHRGGVRGRRAPRRSSPTWRRPRAPRACTSSPATPRSSDGGAADGLYITTAGVGVVPAGRSLGAGRGATAGDVVLVSGTHRRPRHGGDARPRRPRARGRHPLRHRTARRPGRALSSPPRRHRAGCATRPAAGSGTVCNELARDTGLAVVLDEAALPIDPAVNGACDLLGIDPLYVANEGKLVAVVPAGRGRRRARRAARPPGRARRRADRRDRRRARGHRRAAARRSAAPASSTCSSAIRCPGSADDAMARTQLRVTGHGAGSRVPSVRVPPRRARSGSSGVGAQRQRRRAHRRRGRRRRHRRARRGGSSSEPPPLARVDADRGEPVAPAGGAATASASSRATTAAPPTRPGRASTPRRAPTASPRSTIPPTAATATRSRTARTAGRGTRSCRRVPYDRPATTMAAFAMCAACQARVRRPRRPPLPRAAQRLPRVRTAAALVRRDRHAAGSRRRRARPRPSALLACRTDRRGQGHRRLPPRGATPTDDGRRRAAPAQGARRQAVRGDGRPTSATPRAAVRARRPGRRSLDVAGPSDRAVPRAGADAPVVAVGRARGSPSSG